MEEAFLKLQEAILKPLIPVVEIMNDHLRITACILWGLAILFIVAAFLCGR
jgi:hypothetical protein